MKKKFTAKRSLSLFFSIVILFSCFGVITMHQDQVNASDSVSFYTKGHTKLFRGTTRNNLRYFRPNDYMTRVEMARVISNMVSDYFISDPKTAHVWHNWNWVELSKFSDLRSLPEACWQREVIQVCVCRSLMQGYPDGTFKPNRVVTRAEFLKSMVYYFKISPSKAPNGSLWSSNYYYTAAKRGWLPGYINQNNYWNSTYYSNSPITRGEAAYIICHALRRDTCSYGRSQRNYYYDVNTNTSYWKEIQEISTQAHYLSK